MPVLARTASKDAANCTARSRMRNRKSAAWSPRSISRLRICCVVHGPSGCGDPEDMDVAATDFDDEEAVQAPEGRAVHVEEVDGEHRGGLRVQELAPGRVGVPLGCRGYLQGLENPSDGGRADPITELEKPALKTR